MKLLKTLALAAAASVIATPVFASADLAKAKNCLACHAVDKKVVGPSYKDVAAKYKGKGDAVATLATKIQKGSTGVWGPVPMPPNPVSDADAKTLAEWVLKQ